MGFMRWLGLDAGPEKDPVALNDKNFHQEVFGSKVPVVVDVWGPGCAPCTALAPTIKRLAAKYDGQVKVCQLDASIAPRTMQKLRVRGTPTVIFFKRGSTVETVVGLRGQHFYEDIIENELLEAPAEAVAN